MHAEHLIIDGEKMSKSLGNFFTLRDLFAKGHKPSAIRYLLLSVPYRRQLNFTVDGLTAGGKLGRAPAQFRCAPEDRTDFEPRDETEEAGALPKAEEDFDAGLADDLNTACSLAAVFDLVREVNTAMDQGEFRQQDAPRMIAAMEKFDAIFAILEDNDAEKLLQRVGFVPPTAADACRESRR